MRDDALEAVGVAEHPVGHVSTVARAEGALAVFIDKPVMLFRVVEAFHQIFKRSAAPVAIDRVYELLPVAGRAVEVDHDDDVSVGGKEFGIPAVRPIVSPGALGTAVDEELYGIFLGRVEVWRLD